MAQAAMAIQLDVIKGITVMPEALAIQTAMKMLKNYKDLVKEINARENAAKATGKRFLDKYQMQLVTVAKGYAKSEANNPGYMHKEKAERYFGEMIEVARSERYFNDAAAFEELQTCMIGTQAWGEADADGDIKRDGTDWKGKIVTFQREDELRREEMGDLLDERDFIITTIHRMFELGYGKLGFILESQYMAKMKVSEVMTKMVEVGYAEEGLADSTYHAWRKEALKIFAKLAGLC